MARGESTPMMARPVGEWVVMMQRGGAGAGTLDMVCALLAAAGGSGRKEREKRDWKNRAQRRRRRGRGPRRYVGLNPSLSLSQSTAPVEFERSLLIICARPLLPGVSCCNPKEKGRVSSPLPSPLLLSFHLTPSFTNRAPQRTQSTRLSLLTATCAARASYSFCNAWSFSESAVAPPAPAPAPESCVLAMAKSSCALIKSRTSE